MKLDGQYPIIATLRRLGLELTRENYLKFYGWDKRRPLLTAEEELELPPAFRKDKPWLADGDVTCRLHIGAAFDQCPWCLMSDGLDQ